MMRVGLLSLAMSVGLSGVASADPAPMFVAFLLGLDSRGTENVQPRTGTDSRDIAIATDQEVRPAARPARIDAPVRTSVAERRITRLPWTTGVYQ